MCHSPTLPSEQEEELQTYAGITPNVADVQRIEREAFTLADYICKPSPHSMDAYENKLSQILKQKKKLSSPVDALPSKRSKGMPSEVSLISEQDL